MSRRHQLMMRTPLATVTLIIACCAALLALAGCGAGQVTQTNSQVSVIDGTEGNVGNIALRDVLIPYPDDAHGTRYSGLSGGYPAGSSDVPLHFVIVNQGNSTDQLLSVSTPVAGQVRVVGNTTIPAETSVTSSTDEDSGTPGQPSASSVPSPAPEDAQLSFGTLSIVLVDTNQALSAGLNTPVTFVFRDAGRVTLQVPIGPPTRAERKPLSESGKHS